MNRHYFKFTLGLKVIQEQRTDYKDAYKEGDSLADKHGNAIGMHVYSEKLKQFKYRGLFLGNRIFIRRNNQICNIASDYSELVWDGKRRRPARIEPDQEGGDA